MTPLLLAVALAAPLTFADPSGTKVTLDEPGVVYLVDFWAVECKGCIEEIPELERLSRELVPRGRFRLVSVLWGGDWPGPMLKELAERYGIGRPLHTDPDGWQERLGKVAFPTKVLVRDGEVLKYPRGGDAGPYGNWKPLVDKALATSGP